MKLLTQSNLSKHLGNDFPICEIKTIDQIVFNTLNTCFGSNFRKFVYDSLEDYSEVSCFNLNTEYALNDEVSYNGEYYKAKETVKGKYPTACSSWEQLPLFDNDCLNSLWDNYLEQYLVNLVAYHEAPNLFLKVKTHGVVKIESDNYKSVSVDELHLLRKNYLSTSELIFSNMVIYMKENNTDECFNLFLNKDCCKPCGCSESDECDCQNYVYDYNVG